MAADIGAYAAAGAHAVQALMTGAGRPPSMHPNPWLFAQLSWDPRQDVRSLHRDWCAAVDRAGLATGGAPASRRDGPDADAER
jgi:hypothetical protein